MKNKELLKFFQNLNIKSQTFIDVHKKDEDSPFEYYIKLNDDIIINLFIYNQKNISAFFMSLTKEKFQDIKFSYIKYEKEFNFGKTNKILEDIFNINNSKGWYWSKTFDFDEIFQYLPNDLKQIVVNNLDVLGKSR